MAWLLIHMTHRVITGNVDRILDHGPAVLVCNHVSYVDALVIGAASPRPIGFVMDCRIFKASVAGWLFGSSKAKEDPWLMEKVYVDIAQALHDGDLVCISPGG